MPPDSLNSWLFWTSLYLQSCEHHGAGRIAVERAEIARKSVEADQSADADLGMVGAIEIPDAAERHLVDGVDGARGGELVLLHMLAAQEQCVGLLQDHRGFEEEAVKRVARLIHLAAPGERRAPQVVLAEGLRIDE